MAYVVDDTRSLNVNIAGVPPPPIQFGGIVLIFLAASGIYYLLRRK